MSSWLPSGRGWIPQLVILSILGVVARSYFTASAEARLLGDQLEVALDSIDTAEEARLDAMAFTDSIVESYDSVATADSVTIAEIQEEVEDQQREAEAAFRRAEALAEDNPELERAIQEMRAEGIVTEMAFEAERAESAAALFNAQQQIRTLTMAMEQERVASTTEIARLNAALALSIQESDAWERAASPGALTQIWRQGRAAAVAVVIMLAVTN